MAKRINVRLIMQLHDSGMSQNGIAATRHMSKSSISKAIRYVRHEITSFFLNSGLDTSIIERGDLNCITI